MVAIKQKINHYTRAHVIPIAVYIMRAISHIAYFSSMSYLKIAFTNIHSKSHKRQHQNRESVVHVKGHRISCLDVNYNTLQCIHIYSTRWVPTKIKWRCQEDHTSKGMFDSFWITLPSNILFNNIQKHTISNI